MKPSTILDRITLSLLGLSIILICYQQRITLWAFTCRVMDVVLSILYFVVLVLCVLSIAAIIVFGYFIFRDWLDHKFSNES